MDPHVYPDPQVAPLRLLPAAGEVTPTFTPIEQLAGPDPTTPDVPKTMFIRIAMSGGAVSETTAPEFFLKADTGDAVLLVPNEIHNIFRSPNPQETDFVGNAQVIPEGNAVFRVTIVFNDAGGSFAWQLGIWNNDPLDPRDFTWVVSATLANTTQPWIDVAPTPVSLTVPANETQSATVRIRNMGTGPFALNGINPPLPAEIALDPLPAGPLFPGAAAFLAFAFTSPGAPPPPDGTVRANGTFDINPPDNTALAVEGHSKQLSITANVTPSIRIGGLFRGQETPFFLQVGGEDSGTIIGNIILGVAAWDIG
jgi:hypothetical protein